MRWALFLHALAPSIRLTFFTTNMQAMPPPPTTATSSALGGGGGGKAARARAAKLGLEVVTDHRHHRACGAGPATATCSTGTAGTAGTTNGSPTTGQPASDKHAAIVAALERLEAAARVRRRPHLVRRREVPVDNHGSMVAAADAADKVKDAAGAGPVHSSSATCNANCNEEGQPTGKTWAEGSSSGVVCDMSERGLRGQLPAERIAEFLPVSVGPALSAMSPQLSSVVQLNLSRNELWDLPPDLTALSSLRALDLSRNWFSALPPSLVDLADSLEALDVSHNMLRTSRTALLLTTAGDDGGGGDGGADGPASAKCALQTLTKLKVLDLRFNQKCGHQRLRDRLRRLLPSVEVRMTVSFPPPEGAFVGGSAAERDPELLRSQLEPWPTTALRRRLVADFGEEPSSPETVTRAKVMGRLLELYAEEGEGIDNNNNNDCRTVVRVQGTPVDADLLQRLRVALADWSDGWRDGNKERVSINAENYMILTSPASWSELGQKKRAKAEAKLDKHRAVWELAQAAMASVDADFAARYTALAVTHNFRGSPHIDKQNLAPFYGLSVGDFEDGTGGVMVECSARVVAHVNTKDRLGKVDGRYPHWVAPYDPDKDRYSLIFYQTMGQPFQQAGPAIFDVPWIDAQ